MQTLQKWEANERDKEANETGSVGRDIMFIKLIDEGNQKNKPLEVLKSPHLGSPSQAENGWPEFEDMLNALIPLPQTNCAILRACNSQRERKR